jgi:hypothetical protein
MTTIEKTHVGYVGGILIVVIVVLLTVRFANVPNLSERLTFGLTITSLVLAVLAIAYTVYSQSSFAKNVTVLNEAAKDVSNISKSLSHVVDDLARKTDLIPTRLQSIEQMLIESRNLMGKIPEGEQHQNTPIVEVDESSDTGLQGKKQTDNPKPKLQMRATNCSIPMGIRTRRPGPRFMPVASPQGAPLMVYYSPTRAGCPATLKSL